MTRVRSLIVLVAAATLFLARPTSAQETKPAADAADPLAYRITEIPGGSVATFPGWEYGQVQKDGNVFWCDARPAGAAGATYGMRTYVATPDEKQKADLFEIGPQLAQQVLTAMVGPGFKRTGEPKKTTFGGDEAMIDEYAGEVRGARFVCRVAFVKRADVNVAVMGLGTEAGFEKYGRSVEIVAQSVTLKASAIEAALVGEWFTENHVTVPPGGGSANDNRVNVAQRRTIAIYPNGTFSDTAVTGFAGRDATGLADGRSRGRVTRLGNALTFKYDDGRVWTATAEVFSNGMKLDGKVFEKQ